MDAKKGGVRLGFITENDDSSIPNHCKWPLDPINQLFHSLRWKSWESEETESLKERVSSSERVSAQRQPHPRERRVFGRGGGVSRGRARQSDQAALGNQERSKVELQQVEEANWMLKRAWICDSSRDKDWKGERVHLELDHLYRDQADCREHHPGHSR